MTESDTAVETIDKATQEKLDQLKRIRRLNDALEHCKSEEAEQKAVYDQAKKATVVAQEKCNRASGRHESHELFEGLRDADADGWRKLSIDELGVYGVAEKTLGLMAQADILTLGDYNAFCKRHLEGPEAIAGIGEGKAGGIADAWLAFFKAHEEYCQPEDEVEPESGDGTDGSGGDDED